MKKFALCLLVLALVAPVAMADSLLVNGAAAMGGSFGLEVTHMNDGPAYVQDNTPVGEQIYRGSFLFRVNSVTFSGASTNYRQAIFSAIAANPNPNVGACPGGSFVDFFRIFEYRVTGGLNSGIQAFINGNQCGPRNLGEQILITGPSGVDTLGNGDGAVLVCFQATVGAGTDGGLGRLAVVDNTELCSTAMYQERTVTNSLYANGGVDLVRMGTVQNNAFGAGETTVYHFDDFMSFRTEEN